MTGFSLDAAIPRGDGFARGRPAEQELSPDAIRISEQVLDFGAAVLQHLTAVRSERRIRDLVSAALLRRALITGEAICVLGRRGLFEPAFASYRTLLEIDVAQALVLRGSTDTMAKRLALACALQYQEHGQDMLSSRTTRESLPDPAVRLPALVEVSRSYARLVEHESFDEVRASVAADQHWHGYRNAQEAFEALGRDADYHMTHDGASWFVHGVNVEHDLGDSTADQPALRALVERRPDRTRQLLGLALFKELEILEAYIADREAEIDQLFGGHAVVKHDDGRTEDIGTFEGLRALVLREFDTRPDAPFRAVAP